MKFVRGLPDKQTLRGSRFDKLIGVENLELLRRSPSKWALMAENQDRSTQSGFHTWGRRRGLETATRANARNPANIDYYVRYQPGGARDRGRSL